MSTYITFLHFKFLGNDSSTNHTPDAMGNIGDASASQNDKQQSSSLPSSVQIKPQRNSVSVIAPQVSFSNL